MKDLQKLNGLDDDYDNDSGSGPHNVGRRKTIHNLEKAKQKKRNIGTLDVAFKKRFFNMNANDGPGKLLLISNLTPILQIKIIVTILKQMKLTLLQIYQVL